MRQCLERWNEVSIVFKIFIFNFFIYILKLSENETYQLPGLSHLVLKNPFQKNIYI